MRWLAIAAAVAWVIAALPAQAQAQAQAQTQAQVMVYGPGSMADVLEQIAASAAGAGLAVKVVSGHSPAQARQIVEGAPADIFISADSQWMDFLREKSLLAGGSEVPLAATRLVLVAGAGTPLRYDARPGESLAAALGDGRLAIADPDTIPAGRFARAALERLGAWDAVAGRLALLPNVRTVVAMVGRGEVPAGIGFASDVAGARNIRVVTEFPLHIAPPVAFPMAMIAGREGEEVRRVYDFIRGPRGMAALREHGFSEPPR